MKSEDILEIYNLLEHNGIEIVIDGGWGIDALLGSETRLHKDLDIAVQHKDVSKLREILSRKGYKNIEKPDTKDFNFVVGDNKGREIDIHSYTFDENGNNIYGIAYPLASLTGKGVINGQKVRCIALEWVIKFHENYDPEEKDFNDVKALMNKFNIAPPRNYIGRL
jgi:lincosamide nucleotidyltransferase A/C/D/E